ncbi:MAG: DUF3108 domain-containing protein [Bacteroidota bacterium]
MIRVVPVLGVFLCLFVFLSGFFLPSSVVHQESEGVFLTGERLEYKVKWLFFRLGTITVTTNRVPDTPGIFRTSITLDSNPDLFFISIHNRYEALVNSDPVRCEEFRSLEIDGDDTLLTSYTFDESTRRVHMWQSVLPADSVLREEIKDSVDRFYDGASLFFFARTMLHKDTSLTVPTLVEFDMFSTDLTVTSEVVPTEIGSMEEPIITRELFGRANFEGSTFGGFSGDFKGWFSNDAAAVPIRAEMSITLGTVNIELERWIRDGWAPPKRNLQR